VRIAQLVHQYPPSYVGGTELYTQSLSRALVERGHDVAVFCRESAPGVGSERAVEEGVLVVRMWADTPSASRRFLSTFGDRAASRLFEQFLDDVQPDIVHIQHLMGLPVNSIQRLRQRRIPFVITLHDYWWVCANAQLITNYSGALCDGPRFYLNCACCALARARERPGHPQASGCHLWPVAPALAPLLAWRGHLLHAALRQAQRLIAPSRFVQRWYNSQGVRRGSVECISHGVDRPHRLTDHREASTPLQLAYVGGLSWQKGVHIVVDAAAGLNAGLNIAGDESFDPDYVASLKAGAPANVHFLGRLSRHQVWKLLSRSHAVLIPSLWHETFSMIAHESFAAGVPVIASRVGALADAVCDGENGLLVAPGDVEAWRGALRGLVDDPDLLAKLQVRVQPPMGLSEHVDRVERLYGACAAQG
jgi:glycosyltransferase involved in cell wall biosynthesis